MARLIAVPTVVPAVGDPSKTIVEFVGEVNTATHGVSLAVMESPGGWAEPGQTPEFDEYTLVLDGQVVVESRDAAALVVQAGQAVHAASGEWVRYSTPDPAGARYIAVCVPAFSPGRVHRDDA
ncbi:MAG: cupin domain-containing protein [Acidimicrobiales bacterium]